MNTVLIYSNRDEPFPTAAPIVAYRVTADV